MIKRIERGGAGFGAAVVREPAFPLQMSSRDPQERWQRDEQGHNKYPRILAQKIPLITMSSPARCFISDPLVVYSHLDKLQALGLSFHLLLRRQAFVCQAAAESITHTSHPHHQPW